MAFAEIGRQCYNAKEQWYMKKFKGLSAGEKAQYICILALYPLYMLFERLGKTVKLFGTQKRRISASVLSLAVLVTAISVPAFAATGEGENGGTAVYADETDDEPSEDTDFNITLSGVKITGANYKDVFAGTEDAGKASYDYKTKTLTINGLNITKKASRNSQILSIKDSGVTLNILGENSFVQTANKVSYTLNTVYSSGDLIIDGAGSLYIENGTSKYDVYGIKCEGAFTQKGGKVTVKNGNSTAKSGLYNNQAVYVSKSITLTGGELSATAGKAVQLSAALMTTSKDIVINGATVNLTAGEGKDSYALYTNENMYFENSKMTITSGKGTNNSRGIQGGDGKKVTAKDCTINASSDEALYSLPIWASELELTDTDVTAVGGTASDESYGISAAKYTQNGGNVSVTGGDATNWSIGLWSNDAEILGGTLITKVGTSDGTNAITSSPTFGEFKATVTAGQSEQTAVKVASPDSNTYWNSLYVKIEPYVHEHIWSNGFSSDDGHHWHECQADDCDISDNANKDGYAEHSFTEKIVGEQTLAEQATYTTKAKYYYSCICGAKGSKTFEYGDVLVDDICPTGDIFIKEDSIKKALNTITFGLFFKETVVVTITAEDGQSGVKSVGTYVSEEVLSEDQVKALTGWREYTKPLAVIPSTKIIIYAKITDNQGNVTIIGSDGITVDNTPPEISGINEDGEYCLSTEFTVSDKGGLDTVKINDTVVNETDGKYTTEGFNGTLNIVAADKAGNSSAMTITVNASHTYDNACDDECNVCGEKREITHSFEDEWKFDQNGHWHECSVCHIKKDEAAHGAEADDGDCTTALHCDVCGAVVKEGEQAHDFTKKLIDEAHLKAAADCEHAAEYFYGCTRCDSISDKDTFTDGEALGHDFTKKVIDEAHLKAAANCENAAEYFYGCTRCDSISDKDTFTDGKALGHDFDEGKVTEAATAAKEGKKVFTCKRCNEQKTEIIPKLAPTVTAGQNGSFTKGQKEGLTFVCDGAKEDLKSVKVDGKTINASEYTLSDEELEITLSPDYLAALSAGKHTVEIELAVGSALCEFTVEDKKQEQDDPIVVTPDHPSDNGKGDTATNDGSQKGQNDQNGQSDGASNANANASTANPKSGESGAVAAAAALMLAAGCALVAFKKKK